VVSRSLHWAGHVGDESTLIMCFCCSPYVNYNIVYLVMFKYKFLKSRELSGGVRHDATVLTVLADPDPAYNYCIMQVLASKHFEHCLLQCVEAPGRPRQY
jgi:hypothetical protein